MSSLAPVRMSLVEALQILHAARTDQVVVSTMAAAREWMKLGTHPLDFVYAPSSMGQAPNLGLGIALARPERQVIVCNGDGCMLMNLGALVTITAAAPPNFVLIVCDNGVYEVTGGQATAATAAGRQGNREIDFASIARSCGFEQVFAFHDAAAWRAELPNVLATRGPTFVALRVEPMPGGLVPKSPAPAAARARAFAAACQGH
jgi:thiamine pyrophosphate-dependent acetolactate synthase large subunit-like protein